MRQPRPDPQIGKSALMSGQVGELVNPAEFSVHNVIMAFERYSYEGNWLFCVFDQSDICAARVGFGRGRFDWQDYGLQNQCISDQALFYRIEVITSSGVYAYVASDENSGRNIESSTNVVDISLSESNTAKFQIRGWPQMSWHFKHPANGLTVDLKADVQRMVIWPDCIMPRNTFSLCVGSCSVEGAIEFDGKIGEVSGGAFYDHPRVTVQSNRVPPFGWYLYAPLRFADGSCLVSNYHEDILGHKNFEVSMGFLERPDGTCLWLTDCQIRNMRVGEDGNPVSWETELRGPGALIRYRASIVGLALARSWDAAGSAGGPANYPGFPLLMSAEGEYKLGPAMSLLQDGRGIAEFLAHPDSLLLRP
jgi:hypothetical protein